MPLFRPHHLDHHLLLADLIPLCRDGCDVLGGRATHFQQGLSTSHFLPVHIDGSGGYFRFELVELRLLR